MATTAPEGDAAAPPRPGLRDAAAAFRERNFAVFWTGALLSSTGGWVQQAAVPFAIFEMTGSATWVGLAAFLGFLPAVFMGPLGGSLADRLPRRSILLVTQTSMGGAALALWLVFASGNESPGLVVFIVALHGVVAGLNIPSWQAFISELVPRHLLLNAVTLNSAQFNAARALGPALAGALIAGWGVTTAFLVNALSYGAVIAALLMIRTTRRPERAGGRARILAEFADTARYIRARPGMAVCVQIVFLLGFLGSPVFSLVKVFTDEVFEVGDLAFGFLGSALGIGAVIGAPFIAGRGSGVPRSRLAYGAVVLYGASLSAFALSPTYALAVVALLVAGAGYLALASTLNTTLQLQVTETMRGKVLALYIMGLTSSVPLGSLLQGWTTDLVGPRATVAAAGVLFVLGGIWLGPVRGRIAHMDDAGDDALDLAPGPVGAEPSGA